MTKNIKIELCLIEMINDCFNNNISSGHSIRVFFFYRYYFTKWYLVINAFNAKIMIELHFNELLPSIKLNVYELLYTNVCSVITAMWIMTLKFFISILSIDRWM